MKSRLFISFLFSFICFFMVAQKGHLTGKIIDEKSNSPILYVTVSLHNYLDSSLISGVITDEQGKFKIQDIILNSSYILKCSFIGYKTYFKRIDFNNEKSIHLGDIFISPSIEMLKGVEIIADKPMVTYEIDKKVVNVEQMNTVASQTAVQVLANITSVSVDIDGNVSLRGSQGFTLLIDGRPSAMPNSEALQLIQASNIKDIDQMSHKLLQLEDIIKQQEQNNA